MKSATKLCSVWVRTDSLSPRQQICRKGPLGMRPTSSCITWPGARAAAFLYSDGHVCTAINIQEIPYATREFGTSNLRILTIFAECIGILIHVYTKRWLILRSHSVHIVACKPMQAQISGYKYHFCVTLPTLGGDPAAVSLQ